MCGTRGSSGSAANNRNREGKGKLLRGGRSCEGQGPPQGPGRDPEGPCGSLRVGVSAPHRPPEVPVPKRCARLGRREVPEGGQSPPEPPPSTQPTGKPGSSATPGAGKTKPPRGQKEPLGGCAVSSCPGRGSVRAARGPPWEARGPPRAAAAPSPSRPSLPASPHSHKHSSTT